MADSSHGLDAEIQKFEQKHGENPEGRYFVPLANAYRKNGDLEHAEALLRAGLQHHPDYLSAHIVLARCLVDRGAVAEAEEEFRRVIAGDAQNLVALRALGDLAAASGRRAEAVSWYEQLLAIDPMSSEGREALEAVRSAPAEAPPTPEVRDADAFTLHAETDEAEAPHDDGGFAPIELDGGFELPAPAEESGEQEPPLGLDSFEVVGMGAEEGEPVRLEGLEDDAQHASSPAGSLLDEEEDPGFGTESAGEMDSLLEPVMDGEGAAEDGADATSAPADFSLDLPAFEAGTPEEPEALSGFGGDTDAEGSGEEEVEVVTETIAELYAAQGFPQRALGVYQELVRRRGEEPALMRRIAQLERGPEPHLPSEEEAAEAEAELEAAEAEAADGAARPEADAGADEPQAAGVAEAAGETGGWDDSGRGSTDDPFADSFAHGFGGAGEEGAAAEVVEQEEGQVVEQVVEQREEQREEQEAEEEGVQVAEVEHQPAQEEAREAAPTVADFFRGLLAWKPGAGAAAGAGDGAGSGESAVAAEEPSLTDTGTASWEAVGPLGEESAAPAEGAEPAPGDPEAPEDEPSPWDAPDSDDEPSPWDAPAPDDEPAPWDAPAPDDALEAAPAPDDAPDAVPAPEAAAPPAGEAPASEAADATPAPEAADAPPGPEAPAPPAAAGDASSEGDEEDLESFQSWLRSLKR